jgi:hypothetical protein
MKRFMIWLLAIVVICAFLISGCTEDGDEEKTINVSGWITDGYDGIALEGVEIEVIKEWYEFDTRMPAKPHPTKKVEELRTDSQGHFSVDLPAVYGSAWYTFHLSYEDYFDASFQWPTTAHEEEMDLLQNVSMSAKVDLGGYIVGPIDEPVENAAVALVGDGDTMTTLHRFTTTGSSGGFSFEDIRAGKYDIVACAPGYGLVVKHNVDVGKVFENEEFVGTDVISYDVIQVNGTLDFSHGSTSYKHALVWAEDENGTVVSMTESTDEGTFVLEVAPGSYYFNTWFAVDYLGGGTELIEIAHGEGNNTVTIDIWEISY